MERKDIDESIEKKTKELEEIRRRISSLQANRKGKNLSAKQKKIIKKRK